MTPPRVAARALAMLLAAALLAGCASDRVCAPAGGPPAAVPPPNWREAVTFLDHNKLRKAREAFLDGLAQARGGGFAAQVAGSDRLFDPDFAQDGVTLAPGDYRCRTYSLGRGSSIAVNSRINVSIGDNRDSGGAAPGRPPFVAGPPAPCRIEADGRLQRLFERDGPQRLSGRVYPDDPSRLVFLGSRLLPDEATALHYSRDQDRNTIGIIQRIGEGRWRMAIPYPAWGATVQLVEIVRG